jgi:hypothetical protein
VRRAVEDLAMHAAGLGHEPAVLGLRLPVGCPETRSLSGTRGQLCDRTPRALAEALGIEPTAFPGGHIGFTEDPDAFATRLRAAIRNG